MSDKKLTGQAESQICGAKIEQSLLPQSPVPRRGVATRLLGAVASGPVPCSYRSSRMIWPLGMTCTDFCPAAFLR